MYQKAHIISCSSFTHTHTHTHNVALLSDLPENLGMAKKRNENSRWYDCFDIQVLCCWISILGIAGHSSWNKVCVDMICSRRAKVLRNTSERRAHRRVRWAAACPVATTSWRPTSRKARGGKCVRSPTCSGSPGGGGGGCNLVITCNYQNPNVEGRDFLDSRVSFQERINKHERRCS